MQQSSLRPTHVVTCFLLHTKDTETRLLIVRRSQRVGSYRGHWAGISGFLEPGVTPEQQAYTEILEETGLTQAQVRLLKRGEIVEYIDKELGRHFFIHPFLFAVLTPEAVQTDWEAIEIRWILPEELTDYETVPRLAEVYQSALQGVSLE